MSDAQVTEYDEWCAQFPWVGGHLKFTAKVIALVEKDALQAYANDSEACGYICGPASDPAFCDEHVAMENLANKLHKLDPEVYFRDARTFFAFNEKRFDDAVQKGKGVRPVKVLYHSHLDAGAYFSPTDKAVMSVGQAPATEGGDVVLGDGPNWPLVFLVTSVVAGAIEISRLYAWDGSDFVERPFSVVDAE